MVHLFVVLATVPLASAHAAGRSCTTVLISGLAGSAAGVKVDSALRIGDVPWPVDADRLSHFAQVIVELMIPPGQLAATFFSTTGPHFLSAYDTGHTSPSSRFAASWKPRVE